MPVFPLPGILGFSTRFSGTSSSAAANSTAELSLFPSGTGSKTLDANWLQPGRTVRIVIRGTYSSALVPGAAEFKVKLGSTVVASASSIALLGSATNENFLLISTITCKTSGATGTVIASGETRYSGGLSSSSTVPLNAANVVIDTTIGLAIDATVKYGVASASNSISTYTATIELLQQ